MIDLQIVVWDLSRNEATSSLPTFGGYVYALTNSNTPGRMAIGVGDNMLRVWNYGSPRNPYSHSVFWQGIKSKITSVSVAVIYCFDCDIICVILYIYTYRGIS